MLRIRSDLNVAIDEAEEQEDESDRRYRAILFSLGKGAETSKGVGHSPAGEDDVFPDQDVEKTRSRAAPPQATLMLFPALPVASGLFQSHEPFWITLGILSLLVRVHGLAC
jgi:hypothetical protein